MLHESAKGDVAVQCLFCMHHGRDNVEVGGKRKRKQRSIAQVFRKPFKTDNTSDGPRALSDPDKATFLVTSEQFTNSLPYYMDLQKEIASPIVDVIICKLIFDGTSPASVMYSDEDSDTAQSLEVRATAKLQHQLNVMKISKKADDGDL
ncbi:hypothetical protein ACHHYP_20548 [Achlya hypogyna]|uniref:Uncharacterized protein n=1 Tax=Achlya hypogyna TaxID=1202772 RepID=A0A1V9YJ40_ACHHY|nr:hypothetical protein ACHHYP_20548 [Achlya hypogyna]